VLEEAVGELRRARRAAHLAEELRARRGEIAHRVREPAAGILLVRVAGPAATEPGALLDRPAHELGDRAARLLAELVDAPLLAREAAQLPTAARDGRLHAWTVLILLADVHRPGRGGRRGGARDGELRLAEALE